MGVDGLTNMTKFNSGINVMSNCISKPEFNLTFDSMVHVDNCSQDTLKDLENGYIAKLQVLTKKNFNETDKLY